MADKSINSINLINLQHLSKVKLKIVDRLSK